MSISIGCDPEPNLIIDFGNLLILFPSSPLIIKPSEMELTLHTKYQAQKSLALGEALVI